MNCEGVFIDSGYRLHYPDGASMMDGFPDDLAEVVHGHWKQFPPNHPFLLDFIGLIYFCFWVMSFIGNGIIIIVFMMTKYLRTPTNLFIINLAFSDLLMMTTQGLPVPLNAWFGDGWMFNAFVCKIYAALGGMFGVGSIISLVLIGYDRYNIIVRGFRGIKITNGKAIAMLVLLWIYLILSTTPPFLGWGHYSLEGLLITCSYDYLANNLNDRSYLIFGFFTHYFIPMCLIFFFYTQIVHAVIVHEKSLRNQARKMNVESLRVNKEAKTESAELKITKVAITNVILWFITWTPYATMTLLAALGQYQLINPLSSQLPSLFAKLASCFNPVIFGLSHPKYREALAEKFPCLGIGEQKQETADTEMEILKSTA